MDRRVGHPHRIGFGLLRDTLAEKAKGPTTMAITEFEIGGVNLRLTCMDCRIVMQVRMEKRITSLTGNISREFYCPHCYRSTEIKTVEKEKA